MMYKTGMSIRLLPLLALGCAAWGSEDYLKTFPVEPDTFYRLAFELETPAGAPPARWVIHQVDGYGTMPYDGCLGRDWQTTRPGETRFTHSFLSVPGAAEVRFGFRGESSAPAAKSVTLEKIAVTNLVLNGDFRSGAGNYSGWNEFGNSAIVSEDGTNALLRVDQSGYALSDWFPVADNGGYTFVKGAKTWPGVEVLAGDRYRRLIDRVPYMRTNAVPLQMPAGAAYARLLFTTSHDHLPSFCTNRIAGTGLVPVGATATKPAAARAAKLAAVHDGMEIILAAPADPREERAARELRHWIAAVSGRTPPLLAHPSKRANLKLHVGPGLAGAFGDDLAWLKGTDGYAVRRDDGGIYIFGAKPRGTLYGVYALLERNSDIIWPRPNPAFEALYTPDAGLDFKQADFRSRPTFAYRFISRGANSGRDVAFRFQDWQMRNGTSTDLGLRVGRDYLVWQRGADLVYGSSHIGWVGGAADADNTFYPLVDGTRSVSQWRQPCYTHPDIVKTIADNMRRKMASLPGHEFGHIHSIIADNWSVCACDRCMQPIKLPDGTLLAPASPYSDRDSLFFSTRNFMMLNAVAEDLATDYPDLKIMTHAYIFTAEPPKVRLHPNIVPQFAAYPTQNARFPIMAGAGSVVSSYTADIWKRRLEQWGAWMPAGLGYFGYYHTPFFNALADTAAVDFRDLARFGAVQVHPGGFPVDGEELSDWDVDGAEKWVISRLMWDPRQDAGDLRQTYIRKVYREAAPSMSAFHKLISTAWHDPKSTLFVNCHSATADLLKALLIEPGTEKEARALLAKAVSEARHPISKAMIERSLAHFDKYAASLGRNVVPFVDESREEWNIENSPHWEKGLVLAEKFLKVNDWRRFEKIPAEHQTEVRVMHDGTTLYFRAVAQDDAPDKVVAPPSAEEETFPNGDRIEIICLDAGGRHRAFSIGPNGNRYTTPRTGLEWRASAATRPGAWVAMAAIPLVELGLDEPPDASIKIRFGRVYRLEGEEREESTPGGSGLYNLHESFWRTLSVERKGL